MDVRIIAATNRELAAEVAAGKFALARIASYRWPGNIRELENVIERGVVLCDGPRLTAKHLPAGVGAVRKGGVCIPGSTLEEVERHLLLATLEACGGKTSAAAQMLDISVRKIQYKIHEYGVVLNRVVGQTKDNADDS